MTKKIRTLGIVAIGNELLDGKVQETNSNWMEKRLVPLGLEIKRLATVRDEIEEIGEAIEFVRAQCDVIITSGGLGPTHDDMTLKAISQHLNLKLVENSEAIKIIKRQYKKLHENGIVQAPEMTKSRKKMAQLPEGSKALDNRVGGAPGVMIQDRATTIFCLPGVPSELHFIFEDSVLPWLEDHVSQRFHEEVVEFRFKDESVFAPAIDVVMNKVPRVWIKSLPKRYGTSKTLRVWISARGEDPSELNKLVKLAIAELEKEIGLKSKPTKL
ncbi:MAG: competence/damage-inducible protein A [Candidatus Thorarchaeota archaeon]